MLKGSSVTFMEFYGFAIYMMSFLALGLVLGWAIVPNDWLAQIGISYIIAKHWSISISAYFLLFCIFAWGFVIFYSLYLTKPLDSLNAVTDEYAIMAEMTADGQLTKQDSLHDLPIWFVNKCLYEKKENNNIS